MSRGTWVPFPGSLSLFAYGTITLFGEPFQYSSTKAQVSHSPRGSCSPPTGPRNPEHTTRTSLAYARFGLFPFRSPLLGESRLLSLPQGTEMVQFPWFALASYVFRHECCDITRNKFPHWGISGSMPVSGSPKLIAAYHALRRLLAPRHPPCALGRLTTQWEEPIRYPASLIQLSKSVSREPTFRPAPPVAPSPSPPAPHQPGGDERIRTADLLLARQALSL